MFGWSYPAGCSGTPYDDDGPEECPVCMGANYDLDHEIYLFEHGPYCSADCKAIGDEWDRLRAEGEAAAFEEIEANEARWAAELRALPVDRE